MVSSELAVCVGLVEGSAMGRPLYFCVAMLFMLLVRHTTSIRRDGRSVGSAISYILFVLCDISFFIMVLFKCKYVYAKDHAVRGAGICYRFNTIILEVRCEE